MTLEEMADSGAGSGKDKMSLEVPECKKAITPVCQGHRNKTSQNRWFEQQKYIFSQFRRLEVQDQGASRVDFSSGLSP